MLFGVASKAPQSTKASYSEWCTFVAHVCVPKITWVSDGLPLLEKMKSSIIIHEE